MAACDGGARTQHAHRGSGHTPYRVDFGLGSLGCPLRRAKGMAANWPSAWERLSVLPPDPVLA